MEQLCGAAGYTFPEQDFEQIIFYKNCPPFIIVCTALGCKPESREHFFSRLQFFKPQMAKITFFMAATLSCCARRLQNLDFDQVVIFEVVGLFKTTKRQAWQYLASHFKRVA